MITDQRRIGARRVRKKRRFFFLFLEKRRGVSRRRRARRRDQRDAVFRDGDARASRSELLRLRVARPRRRGECARVRRAQRNRRAGFDARVHDAPALGENEDARGRRFVVGSPVAGRLAELLAHGRRRGARQVHERQRAAERVATRDDAAEGAGGVAQVGRGVAVHDGGDLDVVAGVGGAGHPPTRRGGGRASIDGGTEATADARRWSASCPKRERSRPRDRGRRVRHRKCGDAHRRRHQSRRCAR